MTFFEDTANEEDQLMREAQWNRNHYWNIGYKMGLDQARDPLVVQKGLDEGYEMGATLGFIRAFVEASQVKDLLEPFDDTFFDVTREDLTLRARQETLKMLISKIKDSFTALLRLKEEDDGDGHREDNGNDSREDKYIENVDIIVDINKNVSH